MNVVSFNREVKSLYNFFFIFIKMNADTSFHTSTLFLNVLHERITLSKESRFFLSGFCFTQIDESRDSREKKA